MSRETVSHINQADPEPGIQVGSARLHLSGDGCNHRDSNVCPACADLTDAEVAALREYFARLSCPDCLRHVQNAEAAPGWRWRCPECRTDWLAVDDGPLDIKWVRDV